jgi:Protein of unknown function DUF115.
MLSNGAASYTDRLTNIAANIEANKNRLWPASVSVSDPIQIVCFGPSLRRTWELIDDTYPIVTVSGAHDFLRGRGITPTHHVEFDWRPHKARHVNDPGDTLFWLASCVSPDLVAKVRNPSLWHAEQSLEEIKFIRQRETAAWFVPGGSSAGLRALELFIATGFRNFEIFGMDSSFDDKFGGWAGQHHGPRRADVIELPYAGRKFRTSVPFLMYADQFQHCKRVHGDCIFNLHGDGLLQSMNNKEKSA